MNRALLAPTIDAHNVAFPTAKPHCWGSSTANLPTNPEVIVLSDVVYDPEGYEPLVTSLVALAAASTTRILMAHRSRNPMEHQFFARLGEFFDYELIEWTKVLALDDAILSDVKIFTMRRKE